jgi:hypothetical protein
MKKRLKEIIDDLKDVVTDELYRVSDDCILDCAIRILNREIIQEKKNTHRREQIFNKRNLPSFVPATEKQLFALKKLGIKEGDISKQEAFQIIKEAKEK